MRDLIWTFDMSLNQLVRNFSGIAKMVEGFDCCQRYNFLADIQALWRCIKLTKMMDVCFGLKQVRVEICLVHKYRNPLLLKTFLDCGETLNLGSCNGFCFHDDDNKGCHVHELLAQETKI